MHVAVGQTRRMIGLDQNSLSLVSVTVHLNLILNPTLSEAACVKRESEFYTTLSSFASSPHYTSADCQWILDTIAGTGDHALGMDRS